MLSIHLADLYQVQPRALTQAVKRNLDRFPEDFMFQLTPQEVDSLRSQNVILNSGKRGHNIKYLPHAFTQEGVAMLSSVLKSPRAVVVNIAIMRTFVRLRELMSSHRELAQKIESLERRYNGQFKVVFNSIRKLIHAQPKKLRSVVPAKRKIGFGRDEVDNGKRSPVCAPHLTPNSPLNPPGRKSGGAVCYPAVSSFKTVGVYIGSTFSESASHAIDRDLTAALIPNCNASVFIDASMLIICSRLTDPTKYASANWSHRTEIT